MEMKTRILLGLALGIFALGAQAATMIKIATVAPDGTAWMREMRAGADAVKKRTEGRVEIKYYPGGVMGDEPSVLRKSPFSSTTTRCCSSFSGDQRSTLCPGNGLRGWLGSVSNAKWPGMCFTGSGLSRCSGG